MEGACPDDGRRAASWVLLPAGRTEVPESRRRKKNAYTPPPAKTADSKSGSVSRIPVKLDGARWIAPLMVAMFLIGLAWIVIWYISPENPIMGPLAGWNVAVGFAFIAVGFILSTKWH
jgi:Cell division protein CrgA